MIASRKQHEWEWRELVWPDHVSLQSVRAILEQIAASHRLGPVLLETRATNKGLHWLLAAHPTRIDDVAAAVSSHSTARARVPRRHRTPTDFAVALRIIGDELALDDQRVAATIRGLYGGFTRLHDGEEAVLQILLGHRHTPPVHGHGSAHPWLRILSAPLPAPTMARPPKHRNEQHGFSLTVRIGVSGTKAANAKAVVGGIVGALRVLETSTTRLRAVPDDPHRLTTGALPWRWPLLLTSGETAGLLGWPLDDGPLPLLGTTHPKQLPPPARLVATARVLGTASAPGYDAPIGIPIRDALYHAHLLGPTGSAKSTVMQSLIAADIREGRGVLVLDPKGDLATSILGRIPRSREQDVVVIDPTNAAPIGFNPLRPAGRDASVTADTLLATFESVFAANWGIRSADIYTAVFNTLAQTPDANLLWIPPLLTDPAFRRRVLKALDDPIGLGGFWHQYDQKSPAQQAEEIAPVLNKLRQLILRPGLRAMLGQTDPRFDLGDLFDKRRIVVVNLNKGLLGADAARLLGTLIIGQLWTKILARQRDGVEHRHIVSIFIDEASDFLAGLPGDLSDALAQSRSLGAAFTLANQYLKQFSPAMQAAVETNTRSKLYFGLGGTDATTVAKRAPGLDAQDFLLLPKYHAYANVMQHGDSTGWVSIRTTPPTAAISDPASIYAASHARYGVPAAETEQRILDLIAPAKPDFADDEGPIGRTPR